MENKIKILGIIIVWKIFGMESNENQNCDAGLNQRKFTANCSGLNLVLVPPDLNPKIEVLDLSINDILDIKNDTFSKYTVIEYLYLSEMKNRIQTFESHALLPLSRLKVLDLRRSLSVIHIEQISYIYFPPSLLTLYLDGSFSGKHNAELPNLNLNQLQWLSMKGCRLDKLPSFGGTLMNLVKLELGNNQLSELKSQDLTIFCQLNEIHLSNNTAFGKSCECKKLQSWAESEKIQTSNGFCFSKDVMKRCANTTSNFDLTGHNSCLTALRNEKFWLWAKIADWFG